MSSSVLSLTTVRFLYTSALCLTLTLLRVRSRNLDDALPYAHHPLLRSMKILIIVIDIVWHMSMGLLMQFNLLPSVYGAYTLPADVAQTCSA